MKQISQDQIKAILEAIFSINAPVQVYSGVQKLLNDLPDVSTPAEKTKIK